MPPTPVERVLIADADPGLRRQIQKRLSDSHVLVDCVEDGRSALVHLGNHAYAVILLDVSLPSAGAERVLEFIGRMIASERPVVLMLAQPSVARSLDVDLVQIVLRKPCDLTQLADLVQSCVKSSSSYRPRREPSIRALQAGTASE